MNDKDRTQFFRDVNKAVKIGILRGPFISTSLEDRILCHRNQKWYTMYKPADVLTQEELDKLYAENGATASPQALSDVLGKNVILYQTLSAITKDLLLIPAGTYSPRTNNSSPN